MNRLIVKLRRDVIRKELQEKREEGLNNIVICFKGKEGDESRIRLINHSMCVFKTMLCRWKKNVEMNNLRKDVKFWD